MRARSVPLGHAFKAVVTQPAVLQATCTWLCPQGTPSESIGPMSQRLWAQPRWAMFKVWPAWFAGTEPTVQWARTYTWTAKIICIWACSYSKSLFTTAAPSDRAPIKDGFTRCSVETSKDRALMRKHFCVLVLMIIHLSNKTVHSKIISTELNKEIRAEIFLQILV